MITSKQPREKYLEFFKSKGIFLVVLVSSLFLWTGVAQANMPQCGYNGEYCNRGLSGFLDQRGFFDFSYLGDDLLMILINAGLELLLWYFLFARKLLPSVRNKLLVSVFLVNVVSWYAVFAGSFNFNISEILRYFGFISVIFAELFVVIFEGAILSLIFKKIIKLKTIWGLVVFVNIVSMLFGLIFGGVLHSYYL